MDSRVFRIATTFRKPHSVLLYFPKNDLYLISLSFNICLGFSKNITLLYPYSFCSVILILLLISKLVTKLKEVCYFTKLDVY